MGKIQKLRQWRGYALMVMVCYALSSAIVRAEVIHDGSMQPCAPSCELAGPDYQINSGQGRLSNNNQNLFHSFSEFNLATGESANFNSTVSVQNIISRVTGGNLSSIDGTIRSNVSGANLWLINPTGIVFGANARLDVSGSFHATTADYLKLGNDGRFGADISKPVNTILSSSPPSAFGFLDAVVAPITVNSSQLEVPVGETLSLVAGDIEIIGHGGSATGLDLDVDPVVLRAASGRINLLSLASAGEVLLAPNGMDTGGMTLGNINMSYGTAVTTRGDPGGTVYIRAGRFVMENSILDSGNLGATDHSGMAMDIHISGEMHLLSGSGGIDNKGNPVVGPSAIFASSSGAGSAGDIKIEANKLLLQGDPLAGVYSSIASRLFDTGDSGNIWINSDILQLNANSLIVTQSFGAGNSGDITIDSRLFNINGAEGLAFVSTSAYDSGNAGNMTVTADEIVAKGNNGFVGLATQVSANSNANANTGLMTVNARRIELLDGAQFNAAVFSGTGQGATGGIRVSADEILISGKDLNGYSAGIFTNINGNAASNGGDIHVTANNLDITDGGQISSEVGMLTPGSGGDISLNTTNLKISNGGKLSSSSYGTGAAGDIEITAENMVLDGVGPDNAISGIYASTGAAGAPAGNIDITASYLAITNGARISSQSFGMGRAGLINIEADKLIVTGFDSNSAYASAITASSATTPNYESYAGGQGGGITIEATEVELSDKGKLTTYSNTNGDGGNILVNTDHLTMNRDAVISASSSGAGSAGNITLNARESMNLSEAMINSESALGNGGNIRLKTDKSFIASNSDITASVTGGNGAGGSIEMLSAETQLDKVKIAATSSGGGDAGDININATDTIDIRNSSITSEASQANGGNIKLQAGQSIFMTDSDITASVTGGSGSGGSIDIQATEAVLNAANIAASSNGTGTAGSINILASDSLEMLGSSIATESTQADGGNISIFVQRFIYLDHSAITASVSGGAGNGGNIFIDPELMVIKSSTITANAHGGTGGNVTIIAGNLITSPDSVISASSELGVDGEVTIDAPNRDLDSELALLPESMVDASSLFRNDCAAVGGKFSSFVVSDDLTAQGGLFAPTYYIDEQAMQLAQQNGSPATNDDQQMRLAQQQVETYSGGCQNTGYIY